jgi:putative hydrolase of the HAD superfamily
MEIKERSPQGFLPQAILLDLDDTLIVDDALSEQSWRTACRIFAPRIGSFNERELYDIIRDASNRYWKDTDQHRRGRLNLAQARREVVRLAFAAHGLILNELADGLADTYSSEKELAIKPVSGALETLQGLKNIGLPMALLTNGASDTQRRKIERFGLAQYFDYILIEGEFGAGKPDARVFYAAMEKLKVIAAEACMVGDDLQRDIEGARKLGIFSIWVDWRKNGLPAESQVQPDGIIQGVRELFTCFTPDGLELKRNPQSRAHSG